MGDVLIVIRQGREHEMSMKLEEIGEELEKVRDRLDELADLVEGGGYTVLTGREQKKRAIKYVNSQIGQPLLNEQNTNFASKSRHSRGDYVWWFDIPLDRTCRDLHFLLKRAIEIQVGSLIWLKIPANTLSMERFGCRRSKGEKKIVLEIRTEGVNYLKDIRSHGTGYDFSLHVEREFPESWLS